MGQMAKTFSLRAELVADLGDREDWADANQGIAGADEDAVCIANDFEHTWGGLRGFHAGKANSFHDRFGATLHQVFLKMERAFVRVDDGWDGTVGHGEDAGLHA